MKKLIFAITILSICNEARGGQTGSGSTPLAVQSHAPQVHNYYHGPQGNSWWPGLASTAVITGSLGVIAWLGKSLLGTYFLARTADRIDKKTEQIKKTVDTIDPKMDKAIILTKGSVFLSYAYHKKNTTLHTHTHAQLSLLLEIAQATKDDTKQLLEGQARILAGQEQILKALSSHRIGNG